MKDCNSLIIRGGGAYRSIPRELVKERTERFLKRTRNCTPQELKEPWKGLVIYTLVQYYGWEFEECAEYLQLHKRTVQKDWGDAKSAFKLAQTFTRFAKNGAAFVSNLRDYIYYNIYRK